MNKFFPKKSADGQMLIEVLLALGTAVVVLSATVVAVLAALNNAQFSKNQSLATQYAQEGMEVMRKMRNSNWSAFNDLSGSYCLAKDDVFLDIDDSKNGAVPNGCSRTGLPSPNPNVANIYARQVVIAKDSAECGGYETAKATVSVSWTSNKCTASNLYCHKVELVSCLGELNTIPFILTPTPTPSPTPTPTPTPTPAPVNLLANPRFESQLINWVCQGATSGSCAAETDSSFVYLGDYSGKVTNTGGSWGWQLAQGEISAPDGGQFCLQSRVKKNNAGDTTVIAVQETSSPWRARELSTTSTIDWQLVKNTVIIPGGWTDTIQVYLRVYSNSSAWFDDVSLTRGACSP